MLTLNHHCSFITIVYPLAVRCSAAARPGLLCLLLTGAIGERHAEAQSHPSLPTSPVAEAAQNHLNGFDASHHWSEQVLKYRVEPGVNILINAPSAGSFDRGKPVRLIVFALPNGNTTEQTIGKRLAPGVDWHFGIQHIGAQTRRLREVIRDENVVVAYLEADGKSWPAWRTKHADSGKIIGQVIESIAHHFAGLQVSITLTGHSGGGSFTFGYLNSVEQISDQIDRIAFLDSNYAYSDEQRHGDKLIAWLNSSPKHHLVVLAYDDRNITFNGKPVVSPTGGTYRRTLDMVTRFRKSMDLSETPLTVIYNGTPAGTTAPANQPPAPAVPSKRYRGLGGRVDFIVVENPQNKILHTVLVGDMSGFIHAVTSGTPYENKAAVFAGPVTHEKWIQPD